jgi:hypothetical protein
MQFPGFCGESYVSQSRLASVARSVNLYPEIIQTETPKAKVVLYPTPGLRLVASLGTLAKGRAVLAHTGRAFAVYGTGFYEVTAAAPGPNGEWLANLTLKGTVLDDGKPASMATNGDSGQELAIASGGRLSIFNLLDGTFTTPVTITNQGNTTTVSMVVYLNGRFVIIDATASIIQFSAIDDGLTWDPTDYVPRVDASDRWRSIAVSSSKELWLMGDRTGSIYYDSGSFPSVLVPRAGLLITDGVVAPRTLVEVNGAMMWLAQSHDGAGAVMRARGYSPEVVSPEPVNYAIRRYKREATITDAVAYTYEEQGHHFYVLNFPTADATWAYDEKTNWWHERGSYNGATGLFDAWGPQYHMYEFSQHLVADHLRGNLYEQSIDLFYDVGQTPLRRLRVAPGLVSEQRRIYYDEFRVYLEKGQVRPAPNTPAIVSLRLSNDGGMTWGSERFRSIGKVGQYAPPYIEWQNLGSATDRVFALHMTDPLPWRLIDAYLTVRMGA